MDRVLPLIIKYWTLLAAFSVFMFVIALALLGFRIGPGPSLVQLGILSIPNLPEGAAAYIDIVRTAPVEDGRIDIRLMPGLHTILVETPGNQPWSELFSVQSATTTMLVPFLVPVEVTSEEIPERDYARANTLVWETLLPSRSDPLIVADGCIAVYVSGNLIIADATTTEDTLCTPPAFLCEGDACSPTVVYETPDAPRSVLLNPSRSDSLLVASGGLLYMLELDPRAPQFTAPLFKSAFVKAAAWDDESTVISDGRKIFLIQLAP